MEKFTYETMSPQIVFNAKRTFQEQSNNKAAIDNYNTIIKETQIAISNIENVINSKDELRQLLIRFRKREISFAKDILGLSQKGENNSFYRAYLAMDKKNIIEVRFSNHYETSKTARDKSNNMSQFLFQVVLITPKSKTQKDSITSPIAMEGNLKILTNASLNFNSSDEKELKDVLMSIHDYLISPSSSYV